MYPVTYQFINLLQSTTTIVVR